MSDHDYQADWAEAQLPCSPCPAKEIADPVKAEKPEDDDAIKLTIETFLCVALIAFIAWLFF